MNPRLVRHALLMMISCLCLVNDYRAEEAIEEFIHFPRSEIKRTLPPLLFEALERVRSSSDDLDEAINKHLAPLPSKIGQPFRTDTVVTVRDEEGKPIPHATLHMEAILDQAGTDMFEWNKRYQAVKTSDQHGKVVFHDIPYFSYHHLSNAIGFKNIWAPNNLRITVSKEGFISAFRDFVGINKVGVAMALEWHSIIRKSRKIDRAKRHRKPDPPINPHFVFPDINMHEHIELEFILKKDVSPTTPAQK